MRKPKPLPSAEYLRECFDYNSETGDLVWKERPREHFKTEPSWRGFNARYAEKGAGHLRKAGYRPVHINDGLYLAHRIVTKWMTGEEPPKTVDHHDGDPANNKWENLRPATMLEQGWNKRLQSNNTLGFRGVKRERRGWGARIYEDGACRHLGVFDTVEEAAAAYEIEARRICGEFYRKLEYVDALLPVTPKRHVPRKTVSGFLGVYLCRRSWHARAWKKGRNYYLGRFDTPEEAHRARCKMLGTTAAE